MRTPEAVPIYAKRACPAAKFGKARGALLFITSFFLALIPWSLDCVLAETPELGTPSFSVKALQSQCFAETPTPGTYPEADLNFIEYLANSAGVGNTGNVIASSSIVTSSIGIIAVTTGVNLVKEAGAQNGAHLSTCLDSLVDAADYPDYSTLTAQQQASWVSKENYDAAKFNSLLNAFGLGDAAQRYREGFTGSGGGSDFDFTQQEKDKVDKLGRIANRWISGIGNTVGDLMDFFNDKQVIEQWLPPMQDGTYIDGSQYEDWPSNIPTTIYVSSGNQIYIEYVWSAYNTVSVYSYNNSVPTQNVGIATLRVGSSADVYPYTGVGRMSFSKVPFTSTSANNTTMNATHTTVNGKDVYYMAGRDQGFIKSYTANIGMTNLSDWPSNSDIAKIGYYALYGELTGGSSAADEVEDYPEEPNRNQNTWIPAIGIVPSISWPQLTTPNIPSPSESPYNPDFETDTPEWNNEAATNLLHLSDIKFDKLFPFCLLFDISLLFNKVQSTIVYDGNSYNVLAVPFDYGVDDDSMTVDLTWLHDLALMIRPFVQILLAALLLFVTIWFWKGILAG